MRLKKSFTPVTKNQVNSVQSRQLFSIKKTNSIDKQQKIQDSNMKVSYVRNDSNNLNYNKDNKFNHKIQNIQYNNFTRKNQFHSQIKPKTTKRTQQKQSFNQTKISRVSVQKTSFYKHIDKQNQNKHIINPQHLITKTRQQKAQKTGTKKYEFLNTRKSKLQTDKKNKETNKNISNKDRNINIHKINKIKNTKIQQKSKQTQLSKENKQQKQEIKTQNIINQQKQSNNPPPITNIPVIPQPLSTNDQRSNIQSPLTAVNTSNLRPNIQPQNQPIPHHLQNNHPHNNNNPRQTNQNRNNLHPHFRIQTQDQSNISLSENQLQPSYFISNQEISRNNFQQARNIREVQGPEIRNNERPPSNVINNVQSNIRASQRILDLSTLVQNTRDIIQFINRLNYTHRIQSFELMIGQLTQLNLIAQQVQQLGQIGNNLGYTMVNVFGTRIRQLQTTIINQVGQALLLSFEQRLQPQFQALVLRQPALRTGFSKKEIEQIFEQKITFQQAECSICLDNAKPGQLIIQLQCLHQYHPICIKTWLQNSKKCPLCRKQQIKS